MANQSCPSSGSLVQTAKALGLRNFRPRKLGAHRPLQTSKLPVMVHWRIYTSRRARWRFSNTSWTGYTASWPAWAWPIPQANRCASLRRA